MPGFVQNLVASLKQALQELRVNRLRSALSLTGITIGIFCIVAVKTAFDSMEDSIRSRFSALGSDVLYIGRQPWMAEDGDYKWWEYLQRRPMSLEELRAIGRAVPGIGYAALSYRKGNVTLRQGDEQLEGVRVMAVTTDFDKIQNIEVGEGRYMTASELDGGTKVAVIGYQVARDLFPGTAAVVGRTLQMMGQRFRIVGVLAKSGQDLAGVDYDNSVFYSFQTALAINDTRSTAWSNDPNIMVRPAPGVGVDLLKDEITGALRKARRIRPADKPDFAINQLSAVLKSLEQVFVIINLVGWLIGGFSLLVGAFGIANIMFVTVRERTKIIGLKKAIGAPRSVILAEFLTEAVVLCLLGGAIGIFIVLLFSLVMSYGFDVAIMLKPGNVLTGLSVSLFVGLLAGYIPARRAARMDPVVAIRATG